MDLVYSDWKYVITSNNLKELFFCPKCDRSTASLMHRYVTDRNGERSEQFRIECPICQGKGKTYQNKTVAIKSWCSGEHIKKPPKSTPKRRPMLYESID